MRNKRAQNTNNAKCANATAEPHNVTIQRTGRQQRVINAEQAVRLNGGRTGNVTVGYVKSKGSVKKNGITEQRVESG